MISLKRYETCNYCSYTKWKNGRCFSKERIICLHVAMNCSLKEKLVFKNKE